MMKPMAIQVRSQMAGKARAPNLFAPINSKTDGRQDTGGYEVDAVDMHDRQVEPMRYQHVVSDDQVHMNADSQLEISSTSHSPHQSGGFCSHKCVKFKGNLESKTRVDSAITWLVDACVHIQLFPAQLQKDHKGEAIAYWQSRDVAYSTAERYKTGGGITDNQFWPNILKEIQQHHFARSPSSIPMVFTDFGSEFFLQGLLCALLGDFQDVVGIEININTFDKSVQLATWLIERANRENKYISNIFLHQGDFLKHDAILEVTARSTVVYANNVVFGSTINIPLVALWQKHLPAGAAMVIFDDKAILSSGCTRMSRSTHKQIQWTQPIAETQVSVSWKPGTLLPIFVWQVSPDYKNLCNWAASASFIDLLGWANYYGRAFIIDGAKRSSLLTKHVTVFPNSTTLKKRWESALQGDTQSIFLAVTSSNKDYINACKKIPIMLQDPSTRANLNFFCAVDCSDHQHPVLSSLLQEIMKLQG